MVKKLLVAAGVLLVAIVAGVALVASNLDSIVKKAIETLGPEMLGAPVSVAEVKISTADGSGTIRGLVVGNPRGFKEPTSFRLAEIRLALDPASLTKEVVVVREILVEAPEVTYEKAGGTSNVETLEKNVDSYVRARFGSAEDPKGPAAKEAKKAETRFIIELLSVRNGRLHVAGLGKAVPLPPVQSRDIGRRQGGVTSAQAADIILRQVTGDIVSAAAKALVREGARTFTDRLFGR